MNDFAPSFGEAAPLRRRKLPDLHALDTFVAVCESGSMALAAIRMGVSQSAVSQSVRSLELANETQLLDRHVRPARPTRAGKLLLDEARRLLSDARQLAQLLHQNKQQELAQIRLGCVDSFAATLGPTVIHALSGSARELQLWSGLTPILNSQLLARELDFVICTEVPQGNHRIAQRLLFSECWIAVFPQGSPVPRPRRARELREVAVGLPLIRYSQRSVIGQQIERFMRHTGLELPRRFEFDATDPMLSLVAAGLGWAITTPLCLWQSRAWLDQVQVVSMPLSRLGQRDFYLLCRDAEWASMADELARITRQVLRSQTLPALRARMPALLPGALTIPKTPSTGGDATKP